jgi:prepilin-type N-terminal cleavage/methylation domain-containing protein
MNPRRGVSLIELLVVISVGTVLLMVAMTVLYTLKETQSKSRQRLTEGRVTARLADQFRDDVHAACRMERLPDEPASPGRIVWQLAIDPDTFVRYEIQDRAVRRVLITGDARIHEDYRLPAGLRAAIDGADADSGLATLRFETTRTGGVPTPPVQVECLLSFARRLSPRAEGTAD